MNQKDKANLSQQRSLVSMNDASYISPRTLTPEMASTEGLHKNDHCDISSASKSFGGFHEPPGTKEGCAVPFAISRRRLTIPQTSFSEKSRGNSVAFQSGRTSDVAQSSDSEDDEGWVRTSVCARSALDVKESQRTSHTKFPTCQDAELETTTLHHPIIRFSEGIANSPGVAATTFHEPKYSYSPKSMYDLPPSSAPSTMCASELHSMVTEKQSRTNICAKRHFMESTAFSHSTLVPRLPPLDYGNQNSATEIGSRSLNCSRIPNYILSSGDVHHNNNNNNSSTNIFMDLLPSSFSKTPSALNPNPTSTNRTESSFLGSIVKIKGRSALIAKLMHRRECLKKKLTQLQLTATAKNIFAIVRAGKASQLQYLLQEKLLKIDKRDYNGCTPLHVAASEGNMAIVKVLLSFGADILALDSFGRTPLDCAAAYRQSGVARYLMAVIRAPWQPEMAIAADVLSVNPNVDGVFVEPTEVSSSLSLPSPPGDSMASSLVQAQGCRINIDASFLSIPDFAPAQPSDKISEGGTSNTSSSEYLRAIQRNSAPPQEAETQKKGIGSSDATNGTKLLEKPPPGRMEVGLKTKLDCAGSTDVSHSKGVQFLRFNTEDSICNEAGIGGGTRILPSPQLIETQGHDAAVGRLELPREPQKAARSEEKSGSTIGIDLQNQRDEFKATMPLSGTIKSLEQEQSLECFVRSEMKCGQNPQKSILKSEAEQSVSHKKTADMGVPLREHSKFTTILDNISLIVCLCGLPGRGKSYISLRLMRYMNWKGIPCRVFNAGNYRRKLLGVEGTSKADFYDPNNLQGRKQREVMASLACEDLVNFIELHRVAIGILDATNTTKSRRSKLKNLFAIECGKRGLQHRLLFIESVCTDEGIINLNILRSKCKNDDFKDINDTNVVIAEFRNRIQQYEKVYETLYPSEGLSFIKIINAKHQIILYKVPLGLGSRVGFFLMNLHPIPYPIYIVLPGETQGDCEGVYGGSERLTACGESFSWALKHFIQDRYVPHMLILHGTNQSVLSTLRPLLQGDDETTGRSNLSYLYKPLFYHHVFDAERAHHRLQRDDDGNVALSRNTGVVFCRHASTLGHSPRRIVSPNISGLLHMVPPTSQKDDRAPLSMRPRGGLDAMKTGKSGSVNMIPFPVTDCQQQEDHQDRRKSCSSPTECLDNNDEDNETIEEVLCGVPGLDNINYGLFSGHDATWALEHYPRLSPLIRASGLADQQPGARVAAVEVVAQEETKEDNFTAIPTITDADPGRGSRVPPPIHFTSFADALRCLRRFPTDVDPILAYNMHFPNGESFRQVSVRLEPALMAVMRTQSPVFVVASSVAAQGVLAFFTDIMPEKLMTLRLPQHSVVEIGFNESITIHPLLPDAELNCKPSVLSPISTQEEIGKTL